MTQETTLKVPAIHCDACVNAITRTLAALPSVQIAEADTETKLVRVQYDESAVSVDQIREALDEVGFSADD
ncbi:MAG: heavy-metal-associated domain-containing protein [Chloroflexi bacterium]|nr:heavy-metal-associated domain-containing protein [Chloroflexota bacterium]